MKDEASSAFLPGLTRDNRHYRLGLIYTLAPVRNEEGIPKRKVTEMNTAFVVKVVGPANKNVMEEEDFYAYENSPIRDGEYYFAYYFNDAWRISQEGFESSYEIDFLANWGQWNEAKQQTPSWDYALFPPSTQS